MLISRVFLQVLLHNRSLSKVNEHLNTWVCYLLKIWLGALMYMQSARKHVKSLASTADSVLSNVDTLVQLYVSLVRPHLPCMVTSYSQKFIILKGSRSLQVK